MTAGRADFHIHIFNLGGGGRRMGATATSTVKKCYQFLPLLLITLLQLQISAHGNVPFPHRLAQKWKV